MTTPAPGTPQTSTKALVSTVISLIMAAVPFVAQVADKLPEPYGTILSGILAVLALFNGAAVQRVPNKPKVPAGTTPIAAPGYQKPEAWS